MTTLDFTSGTKAFATIIEGVMMIRSINGHMDPSLRFGVLEKAIC
jgi:hypothetical protein